MIMLTIGATIKYGENPSGLSIANKSEETRDTSFPGLA
jgi:hypothetical protein